MDNSNSQNNPQNVVEQSFGSTVEEGVISTSIRTNVHMVSSTQVALIPSQGMISPTTTRKFPF